MRLCFAFIRPEEPEAVPEDMLVIFVDAFLKDRAYVAITAYRPSTHEEKISFGDYWEEMLDDLIPASHWDFIENYPTVFIQLQALFPNFTEVPLNQLQPHIDKELLDGSAHGRAQHLPPAAQNQG